MAEQLAFMLGKDPAAARGGDMTMFHLLRSIAAERYDTEVICLSDLSHHHEDAVERVPKPSISVPWLAARSLGRRRSLVHTRFDTDEFRDAVERSSADRFVAVHSYMAEPYLRSRGARPARELLVSTEVSESDVWRRTRGVAGRLEARRLQRDELRVATQAQAVGGYDRIGMEILRTAGFNAHWLPLTLPPTEPVDVASSVRRLVLLGNRAWPPNAEAVATMLRLWPQIAEGVPDAELWLVGQTPGPVGSLPPGVSDLGLVGDIHAVLATCRALVAPITIGGGVRVKLLEAAARGLPVVASPAAVGSIEASLGIVPVPDDDHFVSRCRALLLDPDLAAEAGLELHSANARRWKDGIGQEAVLRWLAA